MKSITLEPTSLSPSCVTLSSYSVASFSCLCQRVYDGTSRGTWRAEWDWHLLHPGSSSFHCSPDSREKDFFFFEKKILRLQTLGVAGPLRSY